MKNLQKMGGIAALIMATTYIIGFVIFFVALNPGGPLDPVERVAFLVDKMTIMFVTMFLLYVVAGFTLAVLVQALYERLKQASPALMQTTAVFGFIWAGIVIAAGMIFIMGMKTVVELYATDPAQAATVWLAVGVVFEGLGGGTEIVGGLWLLLISWTALKFGQFPKALNYFGLLIGVSGMLTIVPGFEELTSVFGLGQIVWYIWIGVGLLRGK